MHLSLNFYELAYMKRSARGFVQSLMYDLLQLNLITVVPKKSFFKRARLDVSQYLTEEVEKKMPKLLKKFYFILKHKKRKSLGQFLWSSSDFLKLFESVGNHLVNEKAVYKLKRRYRFMFLFPIIPALVYMSILLFILFANFYFFAFLGGVFTQDATLVAIFLVFSIAVSIIITQLYYLHPKYFVEYHKITEFGEYLLQTANVTTDQKEIIFHGLKNFPELEHFSIVVKARSNSFLELFFP